MAPLHIIPQLKAREDLSRASFFCAIYESEGHHNKINKTKLSINMTAVTPATESTKASLASL
jgi:hypothetical protein